MFILIECPALGYILPDTVLGYNQWYRQTEIILVSLATILTILFCYSGRGIDR